MEAREKTWTTYVDADEAEPVAHTEMPMESFRWYCSRLGITNAEMAGRCLGVGWRTAQRYWYGEVTIPTPVTRLLRVAHRHKLTHKDLAAAG